MSANSKTKKSARSTFHELVDAQKEECLKNLNEPRYLLTIYQKGDERMSIGDKERQDLPKRTYFHNASLNDIKKFIENIVAPQWSHPDLRKEDLTEEEKLAIPFEEKRWSIVYDFIIEPMTKELEDSYLDAVQRDFFKGYRQIYGTGRVPLSEEEWEKNCEEGFEEKTYIVQTVEGSKVSEK